MNTNVVDSEKLHGIECNVLRPTGKLSVLI